MQKMCPVHAAQSRPVRVCGLNFGDQGRIPDPAAEGDPRLLILFRAVLGR